MQFTHKEYNIMKKILKKAFPLVLAALMLLLSVGVSAEGENYILIESANVAVGDNSLEINGEYEYTVYDFVPEEIGKYTFTVTDAAIALVSNNGMWITTEPSAETVAENSFSWECTGVGQSIWFAIDSNSASVSVNIKWEELVIVTIPRTPYDNTVTPEAFTFNGNKNALQYVDTFDEIENTAVLGEDGYYHLDSAEGPILYANLADSMMSLADAYGYGQLVAVIYEDGEAVVKIDFNAAFEDYFNCSDEGFYPLTADIIKIYQEMGKSNSWYGADGWVGGELDDAWMYACYYLGESNGLGDVNNDGDINQYDYILVKRHYFETRILTSEEEIRADVNDDGTVDQYDYVLIARHYFGTFVIG